jgi:thiamine pyrophosphokinase
MTIREKNIQKFKLIREANKYLIQIQGFTYPLTNKNWKVELQLNIDNEEFNPIWLLTQGQMFKHSLNVLKNSVGSY